MKADTMVLVDGFDFPVGAPDGQGYYNAQAFGENMHLGDDWNGLGGGDSDLGDPVYAVAQGYVSDATDIGNGWGNVVRLVHHLDSARPIESIYAHCDTILVEQGQIVEKGQQIGTIGNNRGQYPAHLHFEMRSTVGAPIGGGYALDTSGYLNPTRFILLHRK